MSTTFIEAEGCLREFLRAWQEKKIETMLEHCQLTWRLRTKDPIGELNTLLEAVQVDSFEIGKLKAIGTILLHGEVTINRNKSAMLHLIKEIAPYKTGESGIWGVNPKTALRLI